MARRRAPSAVEAEAIAAAEAARMAAAHKASTAAKQSALEQVLAKTTTTVELSDEARERIAQLSRWPK
jgi:hypothetical protein